MKLFTIAILAALALAGCANMKLPVIHFGIGTVKVDQDATGTTVTQTQPVFIPFSANPLPIRKTMTLEK